jgi:hypothetical protein
MLKFDQLQILVVTLVIWICSNAACFAYPKSYGPFALGTEPRQVALPECVLLREKTASMGEQHAVITKWFGMSKQKPTPLVKMQHREAGWEINVLDAKGRPLLAVPATNGMPNLMEQVYTADLNHDDAPDFIVNIWSGGCGLAAEGSLVTFLLSDGKGYKAKSFFSYDFGPEDLVTLRANGPCYFIQTDVVRNGEEMTQDGRDHSFWVYQLYRIRGGQFILANGAHREFPKWVWYTFKENHRETDLLTGEQKKRLLRR